MMRGCFIQLLLLLLARLGVHDRSEKVKLAKLVDLIRKDLATPDED